MRKKIYIVILIVLLTALAALAIGCTDSEKAAYSIELNPDSAKAYYDEAAGAYVFEAGKVDWSAFRFYLYDSGDNLLEEVAVTESMIAPEELKLTESAGTATIRVIYQGASLYLTIKTYTVAETPTYYVTYNAGVGAGFPDDKSNASYTDADGAVIWEVGYAAGYVDTVEIPEREGYVFVGWYSASDFSGSVFTAGRTLTRDTVVYARWSDMRTFTVRFTAYRDGATWGLVETRTDVEYGSVITFPAPAQEAAYDFVNYTVEVRDDSDKVTETVVLTDPEATFEVTSNLTVSINYTIKMLEMTYVVTRTDSPWAEEGATQFGVPIVEKQISYSGQYVNGYCYVFEVRYGTTLRADVEPVPEIPEIPGATGIWLDASTGREPLYGSATENRTFIAQYTDRLYSMYFWLDEEQTVPATDTTGAQITRTAYYNRYISTPPAVPEKTGHTGIWYIRIDNVLVQKDLTTVAMTTDYNVVARYFPNDYTVSYYLSPANSDTPIQLGSYSVSYGTEVRPGVDVENGIIRNGYPFDIYEVTWYSSEHKQPSSKVEFPRRVEGDISFYAEPTRKPYTIVFKSPANAPYEAFEMEIEVSPDENGVATVQVPQVNIPGYNVTYWYYYDVTGLDAVPAYDSSSVYSAGDRVVYRNSVYKALSGVPAGSEPPNPTYWTPDMPTGTMISQSQGSFSVTESHTYDPDVRFDKAIYASAVPQTFDANFYNVAYNGTASEGYEISFVLQIGMPVEYNDYVSYVPVPDTPKYGDDATGDFVFDGWYLDPDYVTPVDPATYAIKGAVNFYAKWTDMLLGTEGLEFEAVTDESGTTIGYKVVGFASSAEEYSTLSVYIPDNHMGFPVVALGEGAFENYSKILFITEITLPSGLTTVEDNAFRGLFALNNVNLNGASFNFANGVLTSADGSVLYLYLPTNEATSYTVPATVSRIAGGAFANNRYLTAIAFEGNGLTEIGAYAFDGADSLTTVALPASLETIGAYAFRSCLSLESVSVAQGSALKEVGTGAFDDVLGALENDGEYVYLGTTLIKYSGTASQAVLDASFTAVAAGAFGGSRIEVLTIGADSSLAYISADAFRDAFNVEEIRILKQDKVAAGENAFEGVSLDAALYVAAETLEAYKNDAVYTEAFGDNIYPAV